MTTTRLLQLFTKSMFAFLAVFALSASMVVAQDTWYVNSTEGDDLTNDGTALNNSGGNVGPFATLARAITASTDDDTIVILAGAYAENLDNGGFEGTIQAINSGGTTQVVFSGTMTVSDDVTLESIGGVFRVNGGMFNLTAGVLTLADAGVLTFGPNTTVNVVDASVAGNAVSYAGLVNVDYNPTDVIAVNLVTGLEFPSNFGGGNLSTNAGFDNGSFQAAQTVAGALDINLLGDVNATFNQSVGYTGTLNVNTVNTVVFNSTLTGGNIEQPANASVTVASTATLGYIDLDDGLLTFNSTLVLSGNEAGDAVNTAAGSELNLNGATNVVGGDFTNNGEANVSDVDLATNDLTDTGTFTMASTLTVGDNGVPGAFGFPGSARVTSAGTTTIDDVLLERNDTAGDDADAYFIEFLNSGGSLTINGTVSEWSSTESGTGDPLTAVLEIGNVDGGLVTFNSTTAISGDILNQATGVPSTTEGIAIGSGQTLTANGTPLTDLGIFSGGTLFLTAAGEDATGLESVGNLIMGVATAALAQDVVASGFVTLNANVTHIVNFTTGGPLTINAGADINDVPGVGAETHTVGGLIVGATGTVLGLATDEDSFIVPSGNIDLLDATVNGNVLGSGGTFAASGATVNGSISSGGDMTLANVLIDNSGAGFEGDLSSGGDVTITNSTVDGWFSASGDVMQFGATAIGDGVRGPGASFSDVDGTLFVNGTLTVMDDTGVPTTGTFDFTVGGVEIAIPGGTLAMGETDLIVTGSYTGGTATGLDDVHFLLTPNQMESFQPSPNTFVETFQVTGSNATLSLLEGFTIDGPDMGGDPGYYNLSLNNDANLQLNENTVTLTGAGADVEFNDEAQVMTTAPTGALVFNTGAGGSQIDVTGAPTNPPTINNFRVNTAGTILTIVDDIFVDGDITLNAGLLIIGDDAGDTVDMIGPNAVISRNPSAGMLTEGPGDLTGAWSVKYFGTDGSATAEISNDGTGTTTNVLLEMDGSGNVVTFPGLPAAGASNSNDFTVTSGTAYFTAAYSVGNDLLANDIVHTDVALMVANNATFNAEPDLDGPLTVSGDLTVGPGTDVDDTLLEGSGVGGSPGTILLDGAGAAHSIEGRVMLPTTSTAGSTIAGSTSQNADSGEITALYTLNAPGETVTATDIQQMAGITVTDGTFDLTMFNDGDTLPGGDSSTEDSRIFGAIAIAAPGVMNLRGDNTFGIDGIAITEGGSFNMFTNATIDGGDLLIGTLAATSPAPNLELGGFTLSVTGAATNDVIGHAEANVTSSDPGFAGTIRLASGGNIGMNGATVPNVQLDGVGLVNSNVAIPDMGTLTVNETAEMDADILLTGDAFFNGGADLLDVAAPAGGELITLGTTLTFSANNSVITNLNVSSASTTELASVGVGAPWSFTATNFDHNTGIFDTNDTSVIVTGTYDLQGGGGGTYVDDADATGVFIFRGAGFDSNGETVSMRNVQLDGGSADFVDGSDLFVSTNFHIYNGTTEQNDNDADAIVTEITVGDAATIRIDDGNLERQILGGANAVVFVVDQPDAFTLAGATALSLIDNEVPNSFDQLWINSDATLAAGKSVTVNTLDVNALFDNNNGIGSVNITDGGAVLISITSGLNEAFVPAGEFSLTFNGPFVTTDSNTYPPAPVVPTTLNLNGAVTALHANRTAMDVNVNTGAELELGIDGATDGFGTVPAEAETNASLTVLGDLFVAPTGSVTAGGALILMGVDGNQEITAVGGMTLPNVTLDNPDGANLMGGDLTITTLLTLTDGVLTTNDNTVILPHGSTAAQGYVQTDGVVFGNVAKTVAPVAAPAPPNRVAFPLGSSDGNDREYAITFNDPAGDLGVPVTLTVSIEETDPMGTNGLPIATQDALGNNYMIGRYPRDFHWMVSSAPTISPSVDYDVEYRAEAFTQFVGEDIERTRAMRRQAGDNSNFWILTSPVPGDNDNFDANGNPANPPEPVVIARNAVGAINADGALFTFGLEANMMAMDPAPLVINAGNAEMVDLLTVFSGGDEMYTYSVIGGDAAVATTAVAGDNLTVTGVDAGATSFTVEGTDGFGDTATATVTVTVNPAFEAAETVADYSVNTGADPRTVDASVTHTGGTSPVGYAVATDNAAVATATVNAAGVVTVTHVGTGTANVTVTATDAEGDTVVDTFAVTVNAALAAAGSIADVAVTEGETAEVDVSGEFAGGTPGADGYAYSASSGDEDVATAAADGSTVDVTGVEPYVIVDGSVDSDAAPATITVTAEDSLGASAMSTFMADVNPVPGNVDGFGPNPASAGLTLDFFLGLETGTTKQMLAANFNGDASVTPFDAALIFSAFLNSKDEIEPFVASNVGFGQINHENGLIQVPVLITGQLDGVVSANLSARIDASFATVKSVESTLGEGWIFGHKLSDEGDLKLAIAGMGDVPSDGVIAMLTLELSANSQAFDLGGEGAVNNNPLASIDAVEVAELPETFALDGNYPNPFNPSTTVQFDLPETADVEIQIFDMLGRQVMTLPAQTIQAGAKRSVQVNASQLASGQYFYRVIAKMESKTLVESGRMTLVK